MAHPTFLRSLGPLGFGGAPLGNMFRTVSEAQAEETLHTAWESGIRYFDTAPVYGTGLSEHRFGHALRMRPRGEFVLSTKVGRMLLPNPSSDGNFGPFVSGLPFDVEYDYSYDAAKRSIDDSLQRLGLSSIDIVYIHDIAEDAHGTGWRPLFDGAMKGAARALAELKHEGVIKAWGLGVNTVESCERALEQADPDVFLLAGRYSLLNTPALDTLFPACLSRGVDVVIGGPYNSGLIAGGKTYNYRDAETEEVAARDRLAAIATRHGVDLRAAALQFCEAHPVVASVIPGTSTPARVAENVALLNMTIPGAFWTELKATGLIPAHAPVPDPDTASA
ncbi:aldo/keto reductase [Luteibacter aegosomatissinici]|uniref:aldo/keto reductase n=1 Tax=Luteibacter aegosomatissinici TaxID=2911539 RepID=UPI001FFC1782|nr:aldo/keto reductase [Luteibacter aegosomatissinici]UPG92717.1 aldo/keto reductase [Luteibacter aegosomatissinici]